MPRPGPPPPLPCILTWYDPALGGTNSASGRPDPHSKTASGEPYDATLFTCAAPPTFAFGTIITFFYGNTSCTVKVNDRGGAIQGAHFDLSRAAAESLRIVQAGLVHASYQIRSIGTPTSGPGNPTGGRHPGGTAGAGGTGILANDLGNFYVGDPTNPHEDFWTAINRISQERYWYFFSDGETVYLADGPDLMRQTPAAHVDRIANLDHITHLDFIFDNTAWTYTATHKRRRRTVRRTTLAKITSPVEGTLNLVCAIDEVRAGDVLVTSSTGPGDGAWLVGSCRRSVFEVTSEITLNQALTPFTEAQLTTGLAMINPKNTAPFSSKGTGPPSVQSMLSAADSASTSGIGYSNSVQTTGLLAGFRSDCSGFVSWVLDQGGMNTRDATTVTLPTAPGMSSGVGKFVTLWNRPLPGQSGHVIIDITGNWFESGGRSQGGPHKMSNPDVLAELGVSSFGQLNSGHTTPNGFSPLHPTGA